MKKYFWLLPLLALDFLIVSCSKDPDPVITGVKGSYLSGSGAFILNEGNFRSGNGSLSFFSYDSSTVFNQVFLDVNKRSLGDIPYSMGIINNKAYILVNNSNRIEVINSKTARSLVTINKITSPRYISFISDSKAYVTSLYSDSVVIINLEKNIVSGYINIRHTTESIMVSGKKAFIANWTGGNKVFVVDTEYNQVIDSIIVGTEPESMVIDKNLTLWVLSNGGWQREHFAELTGIDTQTGEIIKDFVFPSITDSPTCLQIDGKGENLFYLNNGVMKMNINALLLPDTPLIPGSYGNFYKLSVNQDNNEIFVTDVADYLQKGFLLRFSRNGELVSKMQTDLIPGSVCFRPGSFLPDK